MSTVRSRQISVDDAGKTSLAKREREERTFKREKRERYLHTFSLLIYFLLNLKKYLQVKGIHSVRSAIQRLYCFLSLKKKKAELLKLLNPKRHD